jgi:hypothetical protein
VTVAPREIERLAAIAAIFKYIVHIIADNETILLFLELA